MNMAVAKQVRCQLLSLLEQEDWFTDELRNELPLKWEKHGDLILFQEKTFASTEVWLLHKEYLDETCKLLRCNRLARKIGPTQNNDFRSPKVQMLLGNSTWVTKKENGILYSWDLSKCMFSSGNISEKQRISEWDLKGKTVVDMYSGIGYFTLTYLVHCKADLVYACEWNPDAVEALQSNLKLNKISPDRYKVVFGDNKIVCPKQIADHVNLGLIPSSEDGWKTACSALKTTGGYLHVHGNVDIKQDSICESKSHEEAYNYDKWSDYVREKVTTIFLDLYPNDKYKVNVEKIVKVKSFAPRVDHLVADVLCKPMEELK